MLQMVVALLNKIGLFGVQKLCGAGLLCFVAFLADFVALFADFVAKVAFDPPADVGFICGQGELEARDLSVRFGMLELAGSVSEEAKEIFALWEAVLFLCDWG